MELLSADGQILQDAEMRSARFFDALRVAIARRAKEDLFFLAKMVLGRHKLLEHPDSFNDRHRQLCNFLMRAWLTRNNREINTTIQTMMPRGTFKSTIISEAFPIWILLNWPETRILLDSETISKPQGHLYVIKNHFENEYFIHLFGLRFNPKEKWTTEVLQVKRRGNIKEPSISCGAVEVAQTGNHFDLIIADDLSGKTNSGTRQQISKVIEHANQYNSLCDQVTRSMVVFNGTRWAFGDIMDNLDKLNKQAYKEGRGAPVQQFVVSCWKKDENGNDRKQVADVEFPKVLPLVILQDLRAKLSAFEFSSQYELNPVSNEDAAFRKEWIQYHRLSHYSFNGNIYVMVDPAGDKDRYGSADSAAIVVLGISNRFDLYVFETLAGHWTRMEIADKLYVLNEEYRPKQIGIETVFAQKGLWLYLLELSRNKGHLPLYKFKTSNVEKPNRILNLQPYVQRGKFFLRDRDRDADLEDQMLRFPRNPHDDLLDAAAYGHEFISVPREQQDGAFWRRDNWAQDFTPTKEFPTLPTPADVRSWRCKDRVLAAARTGRRGDGGTTAIMEMGRHA